MEHSTENIGYRTISFFKSCYLFKSNKKQLVLLSLIEIREEITFDLSIFGKQLL